MKIESSLYDLHVLVCTNEKAKGESCGPKQAKELVLKLKEWSKDDPDFLKLSHGKKVRINQSGCLGQCHQGIACAIYPEGTWFLNANLDDLEEIKAKIKTYLL